jgi:hypothetical protein
VARINKRVYEGVTSAYDEGRGKEIPSLSFLVDFALSLKNFPAVYFNVLIGANPSEIYKRKSDL